MQPTIEILDRIRKNSRDNKEEIFTRLYRYLLRPDLYYLAYKNLYANKGAGTKGVNDDTADGFSKEKVDRIIQSLADGTYTPNPVRRKYIQKKQNSTKKRPLGIPTFTDKLVQEVLRMILESVYEPIFSNNSHGFRPNRSCHTALKSLKREFSGVSWFIEGDIPVAMDEAVSDIRKRIMSVESDITRWQQRQNQSNNFTANIPYDLEQMRSETKEFMDDLMSRDQRMMLALVTLTHLADNLEQLDQDTEALQAIGRARGCQFNILRYQQEDALNTVLPLGLKRIDATRTLTTECTAVLMPFKSQEIQDAGGIYYGVNAVSHNLIVCNRGNLLNGNGFITGVSGSGKSMAAKQEVSALALSTDHDIIIVDPEREYGELVRALGGEVITISASDPNGCHINALDLSEGYGDGKEPLVMKSEFIMSLYEQLMGADKIEPQEKSIIDRSVGNIYREYIKNFQGQPPTLKDLYDDLMKQVNPEAHRIALALELFTVGSLNVFSHQTNINTKSRILCFDIQDLGENLKSVGLLVMLDAIYNRVIQNRREGKYTHVYIDEIYLFFANGSGSGHSITNYSSEFLYKCWKRFRKYGATLTGITQNVEECLLSNTARMMFANSEFLLMLNQATTDREQLARLLGASDTQMSYVDNAPAGHGLIKVGGAIVPFANELPKNTELYRLMSTRPGED